jgi:hypothetical protein
MALAFAIVLFGLGLALVVDHRRFKRGWSRTSGRVLSAVRSEAPSLLTRENDRGNYVSQRIATWTTAYEYEVGGRRYGKEDKISWPPGPPGERLTVWYDRQDPARSRLIQSRASAGWTLIGTGLIPLGFWAIEAFELLP